MLRGAIIGLGNVAVHGHLPGWSRRTDVAIVATTDVRPARRAESERRLPSARWYDAVADVLADPTLDFVDICTPPSTHAPLILDALAHGLHVLCEKPLVASLGELESVADRAAATGRVVYTVHNWHHAPIVRAASELVRAGAIGRVQRVVWQTLRTRPAAASDADAPNWRLDPAVAGGGVLTDHGWHVFYVITRWIGARPVAVSGQLETRRHTAFAVEDTAFVRLTFPAATADVELTWAADERRNWAEIVGTLGTLELHDDTLVLRHADGTETRRACPPALSAGSHHADWFDPVAGDFVAGVARGPARNGNFTEAALCVAIEALARESSRRDGLPLPVAADDAALRSR